MADPQQDNIIQFLQSFVSRALKGEGLGAPRIENQSIVLEFNMRDAPGSGVESLRNRLKETFGAAMHFHVEEIQGGTSSGIVTSSSPGRQGYRLEGDAALQRIRLTIDSAQEPLVSLVKAYNDCRELIPPLKRIFKQQPDIDIREGAIRVLSPLTDRPNIVDVQCGALGAVYEHGHGQERRSPRPGDFTYISNDNLVSRETDMTSAAYAEGKAPYQLVIDVSAANAAGQLANIVHNLDTLAKEREAVAAKIEATNFDTQQQNVKKFDRLLRDMGATLVPIPPSEHMLPNEKSTTGAVSATPRKAEQLQGNLQRLLEDTINASIPSPVGEVTVAVETEQKGPKGMFAAMQKAKHIVTVTYARDKGGQPGVSLTVLGEFLDSAQERLSQDKKAGPQHYGEPRER